MALADLTPEQLGLLESYLGVPEPQEQQSMTATPQTFFGLPPAMPTTNFFSRGGSSRDPYGLREKAANYQMRVQAEQEAQRIGQMLQGIDPTAPTYPKQRLAILSQFPLAARDPRGKAMIDAADFTYQQSQQRRPEQSLIERAALDGVTAAEVAQFTRPDGTVDTVALNNLAGQRRLAAKPAARNPLDAEITNLQRAYSEFDTMVGNEAKVQKESIKKLLQQKLRERYPELGEAAPAAAAPTKVKIKSITPLD